MAAAARLVLPALFTLVAGLTLGAQVRPATPLNPKTLTQDELFTLTRVWDAHATFTPAEWKALTPVPVAPPGQPALAEDRFVGRPGLLRNGFRTVQTGLEFQYTHGQLEFGGVQFADVGARFKGNATYNERSIEIAKNSLKIDLNKYVKGQKLAGVSTLNFHNAISEPGWMNEVLSYRLYRDAGVPAPRTAYVRMHLTVPGLYDHKYTGLYILVENVDTNFIASRFKSKGGALLKPVTTRLFNDLGDDWEHYAQMYDPKTDLTVADKSRIIELSRLVTRASDADFARRIGEFVDLDAFVTYYTVLVWMNNIDSLLNIGQNFYMYLDPVSRKFHFLPWDQDNSFGMFSQQPGDTAIHGDIYRPWAPNVRFLERMLAVPAIRASYIAQMRTFAGTVFRPDRFPPQVAELVAAIRPDIMKEPPIPAFNRRPAGVSNLEMFDIYTRGERGPLHFVPARTKVVLEQLARP